MLVFKSLQLGFCKIQLQSVRTGYYSADHFYPIWDREQLRRPLPDDDPRRHSLIRSARNGECPNMFSDRFLKLFETMMAVRCGKRLASRLAIERVLREIKAEQVKKYNKEKDPAVKSTVECRPRVIMTQAIKNCMPVIAVAQITRGGINYKIPAPISPWRAEKVAMIWFRKEMKAMTIGKLTKARFTTMKDGRIYNRKVALHKLAETNRAYAHFKSS